MAIVTVSDATLTDIADAIRSKLDTEDTYKPSEMAGAIESISSGITPTGTIEITQNGVVDVTSYASADVAVPQGITPTGTKQISITQNGTTTEDVTNYASAEITVNVQGSGGSEETGSFVASGGQANVTINVTALHSHVVIWDSVVKSDDDISTAPYGTKKIILLYADNTTGFIVNSGIKASGTEFYSEAKGIGRWGGNTQWTDRVEFTSSTIKIINPRLNGEGWPWIDGHTINWRAW